MTLLWRCSCSYATYNVSDLRDFSPFPTKRRGNVFSSDEQLLFLSEPDRLHKIERKSFDSLHKSHFFDRCPQGLLLYNLPTKWIEFYRFYFISMHITWGTEFGICRYEQNFNSILLQMKNLFIYISSK